MHLRCLSGMQSFLKPSQNLPQILRQTLLALLFQFLWDAVVALGHGTGDCRQRVAVAAQRDGSADYIFKADPFQKGGDGFWDGFLTAFHMMVAGTDFVTAAAQIVAKLLLDVVLDFCLGAAGPGQKIALAVASAPLMPSGWL